LDEAGEDPTVRICHKDKIVRGYWDEFILGDPSLCKELIDLIEADSLASKLISDAFKEELTFGSSSARTVPELSRPGLKEDLLWERILTELGLESRVHDGVLELIPLSELFGIHDDHLSVALGDIPLRLSQR
jgi:hypothetical protein